MKLTSYTPSVAKSNIQTHVANAGDIRSYAANTSGADALNKGLGSVNALVVKAVEDKDITNIANANTEYSKRIDDLLYNNDSGLILKQELGADGITNTFEAEEKKIREDVLGKFHFSFGKSRQGLIGNMNSIAASRYNLTAKHESTQLEKGKDTALLNFINTNMASAEQNYGDDVIINQCADNIKKSVAARFAGQDPAYVEKMINAELSKFYTSLYSVAANSNDNVRALDILNDHVELFPEQQRAALIGKNLAVQESDFTLKFLNGLPQQFDFMTADGVQKAKEYSREKLKFKVGGSGAGAAADKIKSGFGKYLGYKYQLGGAEDGSDGSFDCGSFVKTLLGEAGVKLQNREADRQYIELMHKGLTFNDESQARYGDVVFYHTTDRWGYTDSENEPSKAYKGITHVGIIGENGMVMQAGSKGVGLTPLHSMKVVGYAHTGGAGQIERTPTAMEYEKIDASIDAMANKIRRQQKDADNDVYKKINDEIQDTHATTQAEVDNIIARNATTQDQRRYASQYFRVGGSSRSGGLGGSGGSGGSSVTAETDYAMNDMINHFAFDDVAQVFAATQGMKESVREKYIKVFGKTQEDGGHLENLIDAANSGIGWDNTAEGKALKIKHRELLVGFVIENGGNVSAAEINAAAERFAMNVKVDSGHWWLPDSEAPSITKDFYEGKLTPIPNKKGMYRWTTKNGEVHSGNVGGYEADKLAGLLD